MKLSENCHSEPKARNLTLTATFRSREREFRDGDWTGIGQAGRR